MIAQLKKLQPQITSLCREYGVRRLDVFGSAAIGNFDAKLSDFDFVIEFSDYGPTIATRFIGFADAIEALLGRRSDFVFESALKPRFRAFIENDREVVFAETDRIIAA